MYIFIFLYLTATLMAAFAPPMDMEAMQILPDSSWSATVRNLESTEALYLWIQEMTFLVYKPRNLGKSSFISSHQDVISTTDLANLALPPPISDVNSPSSLTSLYLKTNICEV